MDSKTKRSLYIIIGAISINFLVNVVLTLIKCLGNYATYLDFALITPFVTSIVGIVALLVEFIALMMANKEDARLYRASRTLFIAIILYFICFAFRLFVFFFEESKAYYNLAMVVTLYIVLTSVFLIAIVFEVLGTRDILIAINESGCSYEMTSHRYLVTFCALIAYEITSIAAWITVVISYYIARDTSLILNLVVDIASISTSFIYVISLLLLVKRNFNIRLIKK